MERIVLQVDDSLGKIYKDFTDKNKLRFKEAVSIMLKKSVNDLCLDTYKLQLDQLGFEAAKNGLTEEKLNELLESDD
jgi:hypothetical protein